MEDGKEPVDELLAYIAILPGDEATANARLALLLTFFLSAVALWASLPAK